MIQTVAVAELGLSFDCFGQSQCRTNGGRLQLQLFGVGFFQFDRFHDRHPRHGGLRLAVVIFVRHDVRRPLLLALLLKPLSDADYVIPIGLDADLPLGTFVPRGQVDFRRARVRIPVVCLLLIVFAATIVVSR